MPIHFGVTRRSATASVMLLLLIATASSGCSEERARAAGPADGSAVSDAGAADVPSPDAAVDDASAQDATAPAMRALSCQPSDSRCGLCVWEEDGAPRCRITVFAGSCPTEAQFVAACPEGPRASGDRSGPPFPDIDFYYGDGDLTELAAACQASTSMFHGVGPGVWTQYH